MIEWCYQGDNPDFIDKRYKNDCDKEGEIKVQTRGVLVETLGELGFSGIKSEKIHGKNEDAKDAEYFMNR